jgi:hypothetical protein
MGYYTDAAREAEQNSEWWNAYRCWMCEKREYAYEQAEACKTIAEAVDLGDKFRELCGDSLNRWARHEINSRELHEIQDNAHKQAYGW